MSTAWSFAIILMAFDPLIMKYTLQPHSVFPKFMLEHGGAGNLGMLAGKMLTATGFLSGVQSAFLVMGICGYLGWGWINIGWWLIFGDEVVKRDHDCSE